MNGTAVADAVGASPRVGRGAIAILTLASLAGVVFVAVAAVPYFALDQAQFRTYWPRPCWLLLHIGTGMVGAPARGRSDHPGAKDSGSEGDLTCLPAACVTVAE